MDIFNKQMEQVFNSTGATSYSQLAEILDISESTIRSWKSRGEIPKKILAVANATSKGGGDNKNISLRLYDISASAGAGALVEYEPSVEVELGETLKIALGINHPSKAKMLHVQGDSMSPTLQSNSLIAIEEVDSFSDDGIYVFTWDNDLFVKRLQRTKAGIKVISDNTVYEPWEILSDEMRGEGFIIRGRVTGCCQHL